MRKWVYVVLLLVLFCGCKNKKNAENEEGLKPEEAVSVIEDTIPEKLYIAIGSPGSSFGLLLRLSPSSSSETILPMLPFNTELTVLERSETTETLFGNYDYWYKVDTGEETGWIFGWYVSPNPIERDGKIQMPERIKITGRENHDWLTEYSWGIERYDRKEWLGHDPPPYGMFHKFEIPPESTLYKMRFGTRWFEYHYQTEEIDKLFPLVHDAGFIERHGTDVYELRFRDNYSHMLAVINNTGYMGGSRVGEQEDFEHPLVGIWGSMPVEYRLVEPADYVYYLDIPLRMPGYAVRYGTYLLKRVGDKVFETDSSFPDGHMRLEIENQDRLVLTPLFTLPNEDGIVQPLYLYRTWRKLSEEFSDDEGETSTD